MLLVVARDPAIDLAVLKIETPYALPVMPIGTAQDLMVGETVIAIGNAYGYEHSVSLGIGKKSGAAKRDDLLPVGLDDRDIDAIHRGAAHQPYRVDRLNWFSPPGHRQRLFLAYLQIAFNARHSPNESKSSPVGVLPAFSR